MTAHKHLGGYLSTFKKTKGAEREQAIRDAHVLWSDELPAILRKTSGDAASKRFSLEIARTAPRTPALRIAAVHAAGGAKENREVAQAVLLDSTPEELEAAMKQFTLRSYNEANISIKCTDGVASFVEDPTQRVALYRLLETHWSSKAREHAVAALKALGASAHDPWSAWELGDDAKRALLQIGLPSSEGGEPELDAPSGRVIHKFGELVAYRVTFERTGSECVIGQQSNHDASLVFRNEKNPTVMVRDGSEITFCKLQNLCSPRHSMMLVTLADAADAQVAVRIIVSNARKEDVYRAVAKLLECSAEEAKDADRCLHLDRGLAQQIEHAVWTEGGSAFLVASPADRFDVRVMEGADSIAVLRVLRDVLELSLADAKTCLDGLPGAVVQQATRADAFPLVQALRAAKVPTEFVASA